VKKLLVVEEKATRFKEIQSEKIDTLNCQDDFSLKRIILQLVKNYEIINQSFYLANRQLFSLYRGIRFYPESKNIYVHETIKVISLFKRGKI